MSTRERDRSVQFYLPADKHQALRIKSVVENTPISAILRGLIDRALKTANKQPVSQ